MISAKFVPLKYYTLSSQLRRLTSFSVGCSGQRILSPGQIAVMRKWSIRCSVFSFLQILADFLSSVPYKETIQIITKFSHFSPYLACNSKKSAKTHKNENIQHLRGCFKL